MTKCCLILLCLSASCFMWSEASPFFFNIQKSYVSQPSRGNSQTTVSQNTDFGLGSVVSKWLALSQIFTDKVFGTTQRPRAIQRPVVQVDSVYTAEKLAETTTNVPAEKEARDETSAPTTGMPTTSMLMTEGTTAKSAVILSNDNVPTTKLMTEATTEDTTTQTGIDILSNDNVPTTKLMTEATTEGTTAQTTPTTKLMTEGTTAKTGMDILSNENKSTTKLMTEGTTPETPVESLPDDEDDDVELSKEELTDYEDITTSKTTTVNFSAGAVTDKIFGTTKWAVDDMDATSMLPKTTTEAPAMKGGLMNDGTTTKTESKPLSNADDTEASMEDITEDADITAAKSEIDNIASLIEKDSTPKQLSNAGDTEDADITAAKSAIDNIAASLEKDSTPIKDTPTITLMGRFPTGRKKLPTLKATTYRPIPTKEISGYQYTKPANQFVRPQPTRPTIPSEKIAPPTSTRFSQDGISSRAEPRPFDILSDNSGGGGFKGADTSYDVATDGIDPRLYYFIY